MANNYSYDPSANIRQNFKDISGSVEDIFSHIIEQKQRDYNLVTNMAANIEGLKEKVNMYGRQDITNKANKLVQDLAGAINKDGTVDSVKMAMATQAVSKIKQEKQAWEDKAELSKTALSNIIAQKDFIPNVQKAVNDVNKITMDPNILNAQDAQKHYNNAVEDNLNPMAILDQVYKTIRPVTTINGVKQNEDKSYTTWGGKTYKDWVYDPKTKTTSRPAMTMVPGPDGTPIPVPTKDYDYQIMENTHPEIIDMLVRKAGPGADMIPMDIRRKEVLNSKIDLLGSDIKESFQKPPAVKKAAAPKSDGGAGLISPASINIPGVGTANSQPLGKNIKIKIDSSTQAVASDIARGPDGNFYANVLTDKDGNLWLDENSLQGSKTTWRKMELNPSELKSVIRTTSAIAFPDKLKEKMASTILGLKAPTGGSAPAPTSNKVSPSIVIGTYKVGGVDKPYTEAMVQKALSDRKAAGKPISREAFLKEKVDQKVIVLKKSKSVLNKN